MADREQEELEVAEAPAPQESTNSTDEKKDDAVSIIDKDDQKDQTAPGESREVTSEANSNATTPSETKVDGNEVVGDETEPQNGESKAAASSPPKAQDEPQADDEPTSSNDAVAAETSPDELKEGEVDPISDAPPPTTESAPKTTKIVDGEEKEVVEETTNNAPAETVADQSEPKAEKSTTEETAPIDEEEDEEAKEEALRQEAREKEAQRQREEAEQQEREIAAVRDTIAGLNADAAALDERIEATEKEAEEAEQRLKIRQEEVGVVQEKIRDVQEVALVAVQNDLETMKPVIEDYEERARLRAIYETKQNELESVRSIIAAKEKELDAEFQKVSNYHKKTQEIAAAAFNEASEIRALTQKTVFYRGDAEVHVDPSTCTETMEHHAIDREEHLREVTAHITHQEENIAEIEETQQSMEVTVEELQEEVIRSKEQFIAQLSHAHKFELNMLNKERKKVDGIAKEINFHSKRGTLAKRSTKLTAEESRLTERINDLHAEIEKLNNEFETTRNDMVELERSATETYEKLLSGRRTFEKSKQIREEQLHDVTDFVQTLREEHTQWAETVEEMRRIHRGIPPPADDHLRSTSSLQA